jgi:hypothetical protein
MPKIIFVDQRSSHATIEVSSGISAVHTAVNVGAAGILGERGRAGECALCEVDGDRASVAPERHV